MTTNDTTIFPLKIHENLIFEDQRDYRNMSRYGGAIHGQELRAALGGSTGRIKHHVLAGKVSPEDPLYGFAVVAARLNSVALFAILSYDDSDWSEPRGGSVHSVFETLEEAMGALTRLTK
jgi:hypothetical protein